MWVSSTHFGEIQFTMSYFPPGDVVHELTGDVVMPEAVVNGFFGLRSELHRANTPMLFA